MPDRIIVGKRLRELRGQKTLREVANALGVTTMAVSLWERGERMPSDDLKVKIAAYYEQPITAIFYTE